MTKQHFIALADTLRRNQTLTSPDAILQWEKLRDALADFCQSQNPKFDRERWLAYVNGGQR